MLDVQSSPQSVMESDPQLQVIFRSVPTQTVYVAQERVQILPSNDFNTANPGFCLFLESSRNPRNTGMNGFERSQRILHLG